MKKRKINIYSVNDKGMHLYEYSVFTGSKISYVLSKHINKENVHNVKILTKISLHVNKPINNRFMYISGLNVLKQENIVRLYGSLN